ncbi:hypothetical protein NDU88_005221 [Pleurodeles waltl]|uniref:Uncharacterized protein n=1 Tax=Pleurodeles waltl TaxID=8319 RepID=A0AAV7SL17_PLEWA|nr:hypothetical protein NDU88_005221 [Pleurodeles waltl]
MRDGIRRAMAAARQRENASLPSRVPGAPRTEPMSCARACRVLSHVTTATAATLERMCYNTASQSAPLGNINSLYF